MGDVRLRHPRASDEPGRARSFDELVAAARTHLGSAVAERLLFLKTRDDRLGDDQEPTSLRSAASALAFLARHPGPLEPDLVVGDSGNLVIEWFQSDERQVAVEFLPDGRCLFGVVYDEERVSGTTSAEALASRLAPYPVAAWLGGERRPAAR
jgi:hypothetical protein